MKSVVKEERQFPSINLLSHVSIYLYSKDCNLRSIKLGSLVIDLISVRWIRGDSDIRVGVIISGLQFSSCQNNTISKRKKHFWNGKVRTLKNPPSVKAMITMAKLFKINCFRTLKLSKSLQKPKRNLIKNNYWILVRKANFVA